MAVQDILEVGGKGGGGAGGGSLNIAYGTGDSNGINASGSSTNHKMELMVQLILEEEEEEVEVEEVVVEEEVVEEVVVLALKSTSTVSTDFHLILGLNGTSIIVICFGDIETSSGLITATTIN